MDKFYDKFNMWLQNELMLYNRNSNKIFLRSGIVDVVNNSTTFKEWFNVASCLMEQTQISMPTNAGVYKYLYELKVVNKNNTIIHKGAALSGTIEIRCNV